MKRIAWLTDLHLDFANNRVLKKLATEIDHARPDELWVGGDISRFDRLEQDLGWFASRIDGPVRFVLGKGEVIDLGNGAALVGHRGWADGRAGKARGGNAFIANVISAPKIWITGDADELGKLV
ncbi:MAG: hypothetical protein WCH43_08940 [Verrucomicrobiota bacterium]